MGKMFKIIIPDSMPPEESYKLFESFDNLGYDTFDHFRNISAFEMKRDYFEAFWGYDSKPPFPELPPNVQIIEK